jgi:hypothetical protein
MQKAPPDWCLNTRRDRPAVQDEAALSARGEVKKDDHIFLSGG